MTLREKLGTGELQRVFLWAMRGFPPTTPEATFSEGFEALFSRDVERGFC